MAATQGRRHRHSRGDAAYTEAAAFGAALLAGVGAGVFPSAASAAGRFLRLTDTYTPDPERHAAYSRQFELYREVYPAVAPISHRLT